MSKPVLHYFPIRGRAEPIRLVFAAKGIAYDEVVVNRDEMKNDRQAFPCGQCPRLQDGDLNLVQSNSIMRHLGRTYGMYGSDEHQHCVVDMVADTVEALKVKYLGLIYNDALSEQGKADFWSTHIDAASANGRNGGAHFVYLDGLAQQLGAGAGDTASSPFILGGSASSYTYADILVADLVDAMLRIWKDEFPAAYPFLTALHKAVFDLEGIAAYVASGQRKEALNGNGLG